jgi:hypothetical protein
MNPNSNPLSNEAISKRVTHRPFQMSKSVLCLYPPDYLLDTDMRLRELPKGADTPSCISEKA